MSQDYYVERLGQEQITDCLCGLGLPGHVALSFDDEEPDTIEYLGGLLLGMSMIESEAKVVRIEAPLIGLRWALPG